jgi:hypothetical protein
MDLGSIASYVILTIVIGFFTIGLLSSVFFLGFIEENDKLNKEISLD